MYKSANLEGIAITFPETQVIYEGGNVAHLRVDEIITINNLKHAWLYIFSSINDKLELNYISNIHSLVGSNLVENPGKMRVYNVGMAGTNWRPELPTQEKIKNILQEYNNGNSNIDKILTLMCKLMKIQFFNDGNKRTAMLVANHELIKNGLGIVTISLENKVSFGKKLIDYYENEEKLEDFKNFLSEYCIDGLS